MRVNYRNEEDNYGDVVNEFEDMEDNYGDMVSDYGNV
jgi:hypothetical protein